MSNKNFDEKFLAGLRFAFGVLPGIPLAMLAILLALMATGCGSAPITSDGKPAPQVGSAIQGQKPSQAVCQEISQAPSEGYLILTGGSDALFLTEGKAYNWDLKDNVIDLATTPTAAIGTFCTLQLSNGKIVSVQLPAPAPTTSSSGCGWSACPQPTWTPPVSPVFPVPTGRLQ